jgi:hypothetical protein
MWMHAHVAIARIMCIDGLCVRNLGRVAWTRACVAAPARVKDVGIQHALSGSDAEHAPTKTLSFLFRIHLLQLTLDKQ